MKCDKKLKSLSLDFLRGVPSKNEYLGLFEYQNSLF